MQQILQRLAEPLLCRVKAYGRSVFCIGASPVALPCLKTSGDRYSRRDQALSSELRRFRQKSGGAAASGRVGTQLVISCGIFRSRLITRPDLAPSRRLARTVHITPAKLAIDGLRGPGHLQSASGNVAVPPVAVHRNLPPGRLAGRGGAKRENIRGKYGSRKFPHLRPLAPSAPQVRRTGRRPNTIFESLLPRTARCGVPHLRPPTLRLTRRRSSRFVSQCRSSCGVRQAAPSVGSLPNLGPGLPRWRPLISTTSIITARGACKEAVVFAAPIAALSCCSLRPAMLSRLTGRDFLIERATQINFSVGPPWNLVRRTRSRRFAAISAGGPDG